MSKRGAYIRALAALIVGAVAGGWGGFKFWERSTTNLFAGSLAADASSTVSALKRLRADNATDAVELLELKLDGALIGLGAFLPDIPEPRRDPLHIQVIRTARDYRAQFPRTNESPEVAAAMARAFDLLDSRATQ